MFKRILLLSIFCYSCKGAGLVNGTLSPINSGTSSSSIVTNINGVLITNVLSTINVMTPPYNAIGDDTHDDTTNCQYALNDGMTSGRHVIFPNPPSKYKITGPLVITNSVWAEGYGTANADSQSIVGAPYVIFDASTMSGKAFLFISNSFSFDGFVLENLSVIGPGTGTVGLYITNTVSSINDIYAKNLKFINFGLGVWLQNVGNSTFDGVRIGATSGTNFFIENTGTPFSLNFSHCDGFGPATNTFVIAGGTVHISHSDLNPYGNGSAIRVPSGGSPVIIVENCNAENNGTSPTYDLQSSCSFTLIGGATRNANNYSISASNGAQAYLYGNTSFGSTKGTYPIISYQTVRDVITSDASIKPTITNSALATNYVCAPIGWMTALDNSTRNDLTGGGRTFIGIPYLDVLGQDINVGTFNIGVLSNSTPIILSMTPFDARFNRSQTWTAAQTVNDGTTGVEPLTLGGGASVANGLMGVKFEVYGRSQSGGHIDAAWDGNGSYESVIALRPNMSSIDNTYTNTLKAYGNGNISVAGDITNAGTLVVNGAIQAATNTVNINTGSNATNSFTTNTLYTAPAQRCILVGAVNLNAAVSGSANITLFYTNNSIGYQLPMQDGSGVAQADYQAFCVPLSPSATFQFVWTGGTGATGNVTNTVIWRQ